MGEYVCFRVFHRGFLWVLNFRFVAMNDEFFILYILIFIGFEYQEVISFELFYDTNLKDVI